MRVMTRMRSTLLELSLANNILYESVIMCGYAEKTASVTFYDTVAQLDKSNYQLIGGSNPSLSKMVILRGSFNKNRQETSVFTWSISITFMYALPRG